MTEKTINDQIADLRKQILDLEQRKPNATHIASKVMQEMKQAGHDFSQLFEHPLQMKALRLADRYGFDGKLACLQAAYRQARYEQEVTGFNWQLIKDS